MRYSDQSHITSVKEVQDFAKYLYEERSVAFHPDDDFADYVRYESHEQAFTKKEIILFNRLMDECFDVCERENKDIYEIMIEFHPYNNITKQCQ